MKAFMQLWYWTFRIFLVVIIFWLIADASLHPDSVIGCYKMLWAIFTFMLLTRLNQLFG